MRTTVDIDDDVLKVAKSLAQTKGLGLGKILSELARKGLAPEPPKGRSEIFPTFSCSATDPLVTPESIRDALDE